MYAMSEDLGYINGLYFSRMKCYYNMSYCLLGEFYKNVTKIYPVSLYSKD